MRKFRIPGRTVPVFLFCRDEDNIACRYNPFLFFGGYNTFSGGNYQDLFGAVGVKFVANTLAKIDYVYKILLAVGGQFLNCHIGTRKQRAFKRRFFDLAHFNNFHLGLL